MYITDTATHPDSHTKIELINEEESDEIYMQDMQEPYAKRKGTCKQVVN